MYSHRQSQVSVVSVNKCTIIQIKTVFIFGWEFCNQLCLYFLLFVLNYDNTPHKQHKQSRQMTLQTIIVDIPNTQK